MPYMKNCSTLPVIIICLVALDNLRVHRMALCHSKCNHPEDAEMNICEYNIALVRHYSFVYNKNHSQLKLPKKRIASW